MKKVFQISFAILCLLLMSILAGNVHADDAFVGYGVGIFNSANHHTGEVKMLNLGMREDVYGPWYLVGKVGYWGDGSGDPSRNGSAFASAGIGFKVDFSTLELHSGWSLAAISSPDAYLGGRFPQFNGNGGLVLWDSHNAGIGLDYDHISSAGLVSPNVGRDFVTLTLRERF